LFFDWELFYGIIKKVRGSKSPGFLKVMLNKLINIF